MTYRKYTLGCLGLALGPLFLEIFGAPVCLSAQGELAFEAVAIKRAESGPLYPRIDTDPGYLTARAASVHFLIRQAFGLEEFQLIDTAGWTKTDLYSIHAVASKASSTGQMMMMLRTLLVSRFHLAYRRESRETSVYALTVDKNGAKLAPLSAPDDPPLQNTVKGAFVTRPVGSSIPELVGFLNKGNRVDLPVVDSTGLQGFYRIRLTYEAVRNAENNGGRFIIDYFSELPRQLGLRLKQTKAPINMLIVDSISRPELDQ